MKSGRNKTIVPVTEVPIDLVTNSGSGLDPDISPKAASAGVSRINEYPERNADQLIKDQTEGAALGLFGETRKCLKVKFRITETTEIVVLPQSNGLR